MIIDDEDVYFWACGACASYMSPREDCEEYETYQEATKTGESTALNAWLRERNLESFEISLTQLGVKKLSDLAYVTIDDLEDCGMSQQQKDFFFVKVA